MGTSLKNKLSNPIALSLLLIVIGWIAYICVLQTGLVKKMEQKLYLQSEQFANTLAEYTDYLEETKLEKTGRYNVKYENIKDLQYCLQSDTAFYKNMDEVKDSGTFFNELANLKTNSEFYMHVSIKGGRIKELEDPSDFGRRAYLYREKIEELINNKSQYGISYQDMELYFLIPKGVIFEHDYLRSEAVQFEGDAKNVIFLTIQFSIWIVFIVGILIMAFWYKGVVGGAEEVGKLPIEFKLLIWICFLVLANRAIIFLTSQSAKLIENQTSTLAIVYTIIEGLILNIIGYGLLDFIKILKEGIKNQTKNSLIHKYRLCERLYSAVGIDIRKQGVTEIGIVSVIHTFLLICIAFMSTVSIENGMIGVLAILFLIGILGEGVLQDWRKMLAATYRVSPSPEIERKMNSTGIYRAYLWSCMIIYGIILTILVCVSNQELAGGIVCAGVCGCLGFILLSKSIEMLREIYQYVDGILGSKNQKAPNIGLLSPIVEALEQVESGFNEAVQKEVLSQRMKTELISNVSHDLKTPLTSIISYVDLLKNGELSKEQQQKYIEILDRKSQRLKVLIEDLVEASKAASGNIELVKEEIDLVALLKQTLGEMSEKIEKSALKFKVSTPEEPIRSRLDGKRTYRIFANLIGNIIKYAAPQSRVYIECFSEEEEGVVVFKNMSAYEMHFTAEEIVERFKRGDDSRHTDGSGLGLAIAKNLTELQGGKFEIYIDGDLFKVTLRFKIISSQEGNIEGPNNM